MNVTHLDKALTDLPQAVLTRHPFDRIARGGGVDIEVIPQRVQTGGVDEVGQLDLTDLRRLLLPGLQHRDGTVGADGDRHRIFGNDDFRREFVAVGVDDGTGLIELEGTVTGVGFGAVGHQNLEKTVARNRQIEVVARLFEVTLGKLFHDGRGAYSQAYGDTGRRLGRFTGGGTGVLGGLIHQIGKLRPRLFVADRVDVGDIVGCGVDLDLLGDHPGRRGIQRTNHLLSLLYARNEASLLTASWFISFIWASIAFWYISTNRLVSISAVI